jgi:hypothetical protein
MSTGSSVLLVSRVNDRRSLARKRPLSARAPHCMLAAVGILSTGLSAGGTGGSTGISHDHDAVAPVVTSCDHWGSVINGKPDVTSAPAVKSAKLTSAPGGLLVSISFTKPFLYAPEGVYFAWDVYMFHRRADAVPRGRATLLQIEDRGKGWQPSGWTVLASTYDNGFPTGQPIGMDKARNELVVYFPTRVVSTQVPFYWYVSQEAYRAYLPDGNDPDWAVNGSLTAFCPAGVQADPYTLPVPSKLLES